MSRNHSLNRALLALLLLLSTSVYAGALDEGLDAFNAGDYQRAFDIWKPLAEAGDAKARYNLGLMFEQGLGVKKDPTQARLLFEAAAKQGDADAQYQLGYIFYNGEGVFPSKSDALHWWQLAAAQNHPMAQYNLGVCYAYGIGTGIDQHLAITLWRGAAAQGNTQAIKALIRAYQNGEFGVDKDPTQVKYWKSQLEK